MCFAQIVGDERCSVTRARQEVFVGREQHDVVKIQAARFEQTKDLHALSGFAVEGYGLLLQQTAQEAQERGTLYVEQGTFTTLCLNFAQRNEAVEQGVGSKDRLTV